MNSCSRSSARTPAIGSASSGRRGVSSSRRVAISASPNAPAVLATLVVPFADDGPGGREGRQARGLPFHRAIGQKLLIHLLVNASRGPIRLVVSMSRLRLSTLLLLAAARWSGRTPFTLEPA